MKVLIAVDDSQTSEIIISYALTILQLEKDEVMLCTVVPGFLTYISSGMLPDVMHNLRAEANLGAQKLLKNARQIALRAHPQIKVDEVIVEGSPAREIVSLAEEKGVGMIVVGCHGRDGFSRLLLGSVSRAIVNHPPCSVLVVDLKQALGQLEKLTHTSLVDAPGKEDNSFFKPGIFLGN